VLFALNAAAQRSEQLAITLLFGFGLLFGLAVAPTIASYVGADPQAVWQAGGATALFIAGFGAGYAIRRDLAALARVLFWALVALIVFGIVLIFVRIPNGAVIYSVLGLVIFAGLTLFDFQRLRRTKNIRAAPPRRLDLPRRSQRLPVLPDDLRPGLTHPLERSVRPEFGEIGGRERASVRPSAGQNRADAKRQVIAYQQ
jgi:hypothetical protein